MANAEEKYRYPVVILRCTILVSGNSVVVIVGVGSQAEKASIKPSSKAKGISFISSGIRVTSSSDKPIADSEFKSAKCAWPANYMRAS